MSETLYGIWVEQSDREPFWWWWYDKGTVWFTPDVRIACAQRAMMIAQEFYPDTKLKVCSLSKDGTPASSVWFDKEIV